MIPICLSAPSGYSAPSSSAPPADDLAWLDFLTSAAPPPSGNATPAPQPSSASTRSQHQGERIPSISAARTGKTAGKRQASGSGGEPTSQAAGAGGGEGGRSSGEPAAGQRKNVAKRAKLEESSRGDTGASEERAEDGK